jgi:C-5 cytosine-specific DNA methylase
MTSTIAHGRSPMPLAIDLFCGMGGWTDGLLAEGWDVVGFDIERHAYGEHRYPAQLVVQDVLTLHGGQFKDATLIVASPPCQEYSYMAMPWSRAKAIAAEYRCGTRDVKQLTALFDACFRIQREACEAAGHHIPLVVENVRGAIPWVGRSRWNFGSFHLWGDVPALMPITSFTKQNREVLHRDPAKRNIILPQVVYREGDGIKGVGPTRAEVKSGKCGGDWFGAGADASLQRRAGSKTTARKFASAMIAKIPLPLSRHIAATFRD